MLLQKDLYSMPKKWSMSLQVEDLTQKEYVLKLKEDLHFLKNVKEDFVHLLHVSQKKLENFVQLLLHLLENVKKVLEHVA